MSPSIVANAILAAHNSTCATWQQKEEFTREAVRYSVGDAATIKSQLRDLSKALCKSAQVKDLDAWFGKAGIAEDKPKLKLEEYVGKFVEWRGDDGSVQKAHVIGTYKWGLTDVLITEHCDNKMYISKILQHRFDGAAYYVNVDRVTKVHG